MEFERVPLPGWHWSVWSERQVASSPFPRGKRWQNNESIHGWSTSQFETTDRCGELDATATAKRRKRKHWRRYEWTKQQPTGPGPPATATVTDTIATPISSSDATIHVSWQRRRRWKYCYTATLKRRNQSCCGWKRRRDASKQRIQQYVTQFRSSCNKPPSVSWIKLFSNTDGWSVSRAVFWKSSWTTATTALGK